MASIEPDERVVWAETCGELALSTVREVSETCLKVVSRRNHVMGYCWDLNGVNRAR